MAEDERTFGERLQHAWNAFKNKDPAEEVIGLPQVLSPETDVSYTASSYTQQYRYSLRPSVDSTIAGSIYNRIATDVASVKIQHIRTDQSGGFLEEMPSGLNNILSCSANIDQTGAAFIQDLTLSLLDEGVVAAVPIDTSINPKIAGSFDIQTMRAGKIITWYPRDVQIEVYNDRNGKRQRIIMPKEKVGIIENPFYSVMNTPNSTLKRLIRKLAVMDVIDDQLGAGKMDLIIQLPYVVKTETRQKEALKRVGKLEEQLSESKYGIGYIDGTEHITQLNRSVENNLLREVEYLTSMLYSQLGINQEILSGTASEDVMTNYYKRTVDVILDAIVNEFSRKFLTKTARSQNQAIRYFRNPFNLTPTAAIADIADKFTRNEILSPNEVRGIVGFKPSGDPQADELRNRNINQAKDAQSASVEELAKENQNEGE